VQVRAQRELARLREPCAGSDRSGNNRVQKDRTPVRADLDDVLTGVGSGRLEVRHDGAIVHTLAAHPHERRMSRLERGMIRDRRGDRDGVWSADAHHTDPTTSGRCSNGDDGVVGGELHGRSRRAISASAK
jgi:hypothetical protein